MPEKHVYGPFRHGVDHDFERADLEFYGIDHFRPTFVVRIYLNDSEVTSDSVDEERPSYAGKFTMLGHERCYGDEGHCEVPGPPRRFDDRPSHPLTPAFRRVEITDALKRAVDQGQDLTVTVVVSSRTPYEPSGQHGHGEHLFDIKGMQLVTYN